MQWTIVAAPNAGWAEQVFGEPDLERLWEAVASRCGSTPAAPRTSSRSGAATATCSAPAPQALTDLGLDAVRYHGDGTDLTVGLIDGLRLDRRRPDHDGRRRLHAQPADRGGLHQPRPAARGRRDPARPARWSCPAPASWSRTSSSLRRRADRRRDGVHRRRGGPRPARHRRRRPQPRRGVAGRGLARGCARPASSSTTRCTTRTPAATSPGARASRSACPDGLPGAPTSSRGSRAELLRGAHRRGHRRAGRRRRRAPADGTVVPLIREDAWALPED